MLRRLRWQLALLYLLTAIGLVALVVAGAYVLLRSLYADTTDLALQYRMATLYEAYGLHLPDELARAQREWLGSSQFFTGSSSPAPVSNLVVPSGDHEAEERHEAQEHLSEEQRYDARLAAIFVFPLSSNGELLFSPNAVAPPFSPNLEAASAALSKGADMRTVRLDNGNRVRLLTYATGSGNAPAVLQVGRLVGDQETSLQLFLTGLLALGAVSTVLLGLGSWWLSGRTLEPAQRAWDQQQTFVSNASHELRTPLTFIKATAEYGLRTQPQPEQRQLLEEITGECDYMDQLVDDLLLLSRLDNRRLELNLTAAPVDELLHDVGRQMERLAQQKGVTIQVEPAQGEIYGDPTRLRQVLLILLDNALRYTPQGGGIWLAAQPEGKHMRLTVTDNGQGIAPEHLPHLFERFYQAAPSATDDETRHNGLGLPIAKSLVELQGGSIQVKSQVGTGTQVVLVLPRAGK